ncbi:MAG TPA: ABC transporter permease [Rhizomicrobium sp.]|nr:ABC transporter permease [Rhizomicrobium sp.]
MFRNYLAVALRNLVRHKLYSFINIAGLAVGFACATLILLFIRDEISFDKWVPDSANLYRLDETLVLPGRSPIITPLSDFPLAPLLKDNLPEVTAMTRFWSRPRTVTVDGHAFSQDIVEVDPDFFQIIRFPLVTGEPATVLKRPDAIVVSGSLAHKLFGDANPVGRTLAVNKPNCSAFTISCSNDAVVLRVSGVMADLPHNTHVRADALISQKSSASAITELNKSSYYGANGYSYVRLAPGSDPGAVAAKIAGLLDRHVNVLQDLGMKLQASKTIQVTLVPFAAAHLDERAQLGAMVPPGNRITLYGLGAVGLLILLIASFNFTNLATARAMMRAREIAMRKCVGARRGQLMLQFLGEAVFTAMIALVLALSLIEMVLPAYAGFLGRPITLNYMADWPIPALMTGIAVTVGLLSGVYPALVLSGFLPALVLGASRSGHAGPSLLRSSLVVLQFAVAIGLAIVALAVVSQVDFVRNQSLGFRRDNILVINTNRRMTANARDSFVSELRAYPGVLDAALSSDIPFTGSEFVAQMRLPGHPEYLTMHRQFATPEFFRLYGMRLLTGRFFSDAHGGDRTSNPTPSGSDGRNILINQAAAERFGFTPDDAINKTVLFGFSKVRIVGVIADAYTDGARLGARPSVFLDDRNDSPFVSVRIAAGHVPEVLAFVDHSWSQLSPNVAVDRRFLDDSFDRLYLDDQKQGEMLGVFVAVAIFIACLGLFGLAAFTAGRRTREIGIRKVFGARTRDLVFLLLWQFSIPVLIANAIAWPVAWYYLHGWLQGFAYHVPLSPLYFIGAGGAAMLIAWLTVFTHARRVAGANPIHALRYE